MEETGVPTRSDLKRVAEAALFVSARALGEDELALAMGVASIGSIHGIMDSLMQEFNSRDSSLEIQRIGDRYIMAVRGQYAEAVSALAGKPEISRGAQRILAYISKNVPILQSSLVKSFGTSTYDYMRELVEKEFVRTRPQGRSKSVETTPKFREYFGVQ